tara:strand:+ start:380 stop:529 length:150 start_codon:yes stop_codon:yes gene_type:complete
MSSNEHHIATSSRILTNLGGKKAFSFIPRTLSEPVAFADHWTCKPVGIV